MTKVKILSASLIAAAMLAAPAMAREESHVTSRHLADRAYASTAPLESYAGGRGCIPAPRVGAFATAPWTGDNVPCEP
jgi:hypothetical protein